MVTIEIKLSNRGSLRFRRLLGKNKFNIYTVDPYTNDYLSADNSIAFIDGFNNRNVIYSCIYNEVEMPPKEIIERMNSDPSVISYIVYYLAE